MPGIVAEGEWGPKFATAVGTEFIATLLFAFFGGAAPAASAAWANGIALAVLVYVAANVSGGHLNPAVTVATVLSGHTSFSRALSYIVAQILGAVVGSGLHLLLLPKPVDVGCFAPHGITLSQAFGWELIMTFLLVVTIYSVAIAEPSFGVAAPLAIGFALFAAAITGGGYTGAALNPARVLGPAIVFGCHWNAVPVYIIAELVGASLAAVLAVPLYGTGLEFGRWWDHHIKGAVDAAKEGLRGGYERLEDAVTA